MSPRGKEAAMPCGDLQEQSLEVRWSLAVWGSRRWGAALLVRMAPSLIPAGGQRWGLGTQGGV